MFKFYMFILQRYAKLLFLTVQLCFRKMLNVVTRGAFVLFYCCLVVVSNKGGEEGGGRREEGGMGEEGGNLH